MGPSECATHLAQPFGVGTADHSFTVEANGRKARVTVESSSGMTAGVTCTAYGAAMPEVTLSRESRFDRLGKTLRIAREAQLGDAVFDAKVYVDSTLSDEQLRFLFISPDARAAILLLLETSDAIDLGALGVATRTLDETRFTDVQGRLAEHLTLLWQLQASLPPAAGNLTATQRKSRDLIVPLLLTGILTGTVLFAAVLLAFPAHALFSPWTFAGIGLGVGLALWLATLLPAALVLSGRSSSFRHFMAYAFGMLLLFLPLAPFVLVLLNEDLDTSEVTTHRMPIVRAYMESSDDDEQLFIEFRSPVAEDETVTLGFGGDAPPPPGTSVYVSTRAGAFGFPYRTEARYAP